MSIWVKICGVRTLADAELAREAGADAVGLNFVPSSPRVVDIETARQISGHLRGRIEVVAVVADLDLQELGELSSVLKPDFLQLHGNEPSELLERLLPHAYKVIHVKHALDVERADAYGGERLLVDAKVSGHLGGTGTSFDYSLTRPLAKTRQLILAGGLKPETVAQAVAEVGPFGVDVASGVEPKGKPGQKDPELLLSFVRAAKGL